MPRTPLFREVRRTLRFAAYLEATHTPTAEGIERVLAERLRWTRRRFLQTAAVAAAGVLVGAPRLARAVSRPGRNNVLIVGAGVSGLTCAYRLQQNGVQVRVIEAATRIGGRMFSLRNQFPDGQLTELGGEFFDSDQGGRRARGGWRGSPRPEVRGPGRQALPGCGQGLHRPGGPLHLADLQAHARELQLLRPGQYQAFAGAELLPTGGLHFCGEHTSVDYSGFMNGAVESGERVAREILD